MTIKWLRTMVIVSPLRIGFPFQTALFMAKIKREVTGVILTTYNITGDLSSKYRGRTTLLHENSQLPEETVQSFILLKRSVFVFAS